MKRSFLLHLLGVFLCPVCTITAQQKTADTAKEFNTSETNIEVPLLGDLIGFWDAYQVKRNKDGTWTEDTIHSIWHWYTILDGQAIQDDWIKISGSDEGKDSVQVVGTNIRIYNSSEEQWYMAWIDKTSRKLASFTATNSQDAVVMSGKNPLGQQIRNTFFNISIDTFDWKQEWTFDKGNTWVAVSKIHCKRKL